MRRRLSIRVENACHEDWSAMRPSGEGRHCGRCDSTVIDLSRVTRSQAESIIRSHGGKVCGRVRATERGEAVFAPEPVRTGLVPVAIAGLLAACSAEPVDEAEPAPRAEAGLTDASPLALASSDPSSFGGSIATGVMMPIGPDHPLTAPVVVVSPSPAVEEEEVQPTPEQRALTRRKHRRQQLASFPPIPPSHYDLGMMVLPDDF